MPMKIFLIQAPHFAPSPEIWKEATVAELAALPAKLKADLPPGESALLVAPYISRLDPAVTGLMDAGFPLTCLFFRDQVQSDEIGPKLQFLTAERRTTGVKSSLEKGSTIFSETFFNAGKVGEKLDPVFRFARKTLDPKRAVEIWGTFHSLLFLGIRSLPEQGEKGTGEKVDVQIGADGNALAFSVRFDLPPELFPEIRRHALLELPRTSVDFFELRYVQEAKKAEFLAICFMQGNLSGAVEAHSFHPAAALESSQEVKEYTFEGFSSLQGSGPEEKRVVKGGGGGFKKKFSETVKSGKKPEPQPGKASEEKIVDAENGNFLVTGEVLQPAAKVTVSGSASMGKESTTVKEVTEVRNDEKIVVEGSAPEPVKSTTINGVTEVRNDEKLVVKEGEKVALGKSDAVLMSKIEGLEATLKQREELITKLNKEIEEIKDPMKMGVISGIKDNQLEGLKQNIARLQGELEEAGKREKELMGVVDKAIQMKDDAVKKLKELDIKLRQAQGGGNSKVQMLEKQMEEQKRQNKELSKRITALTEQLQAAGKRAA